MSYSPPKFSNDVLDLFLDDNFRPYCFGGQRLFRMRITFIVSQNIFGNSHPQIFRAKTFFGFSNWFFLQIIYESRVTKTTFHDQSWSEQWDDKASQKQDLSVILFEMIKTPMSKLCTNRYLRRTMEAGFFDDLSCITVLFWFSHVSDSFEGLKFSVSYFLKTLSSLNIIIENQQLNSWDVFLKFWHSENWKQGFFGRELKKAQHVLLSFGHLGSVGGKWLAKTFGVLMNGAWSWLANRGLSQPSK